MTESEVKQIIEEGLKQAAPEVNFSALNLKAPLRQQIDIDSYDFYNIIAQIEKSMNVRIPETSLREMDNLETLIRYLVDFGSQQTAPKESPPISP